MIVHWLLGLYKSTIARLKLNSMRFEIEAEMYASCVREGIKIKSIPINYRARIGEAKLDSVVDGWIIFKKFAQTNISSSSGINYR